VLTAGVARRSTAGVAWDDGVATAGAAWAAGAARGEWAAGPAREAGRGDGERDWLVFLPSEVVVGAYRAR